MIKNLVVTTQSVKNGSNGIIARERYLTNINHPNHRLTEKIVSLIGNRQTSKRMCELGEKHKLMQKYKSRKGGRPLSSFGMEFCLTIPSNAKKPTDEQWIKVISYICRSLAKKLKLSEDEYKTFKKNIRAVCHKQKENSNGSNDHVHLIIGKVLNDKILTSLQKKETTRLIKQSYSMIAIKEFGIDHNKYQPNYKNSKKLEMWRYNKNKLEKSKETEEIILELIERSNYLINNIKEHTNKEKYIYIKQIESLLSSLNYNKLDDMQNKKISKIKEIISNKM
ncbi:hypothetical protein [Vibrio parahaemolyticus]|uniref:hypothetical protein n=1 Tax=Vibrio parahaemolyticus TaxID=670 RepID=UPI000425B674|nr:hypothetical protein [Vibrio parahaemolyticus]EIF8962034.1 hypothetical protein [Vibrio parahaemolyticus]